MEGHQNGGYPAFSPRSGLLGHDDIADVSDWMQSSFVTDFLLRALRFFAFIACAPLIIGFIGAWQDGLGFFLFLFGIPIAFLALLVGTAIWFARSLRFTKDLCRIRDKAAVGFAVPLLLVSTILLAWPILVAGRYVGTMSRLSVNYGHYETIVARVQANPKASWYEEDGGVIYSVDLGPPIRVAFNPAGVLDNWSGIIYDPTGDVMLADGFDPVTGKFFAPDSVTKLFNGDLVSCRHLWRSYYRCSFT
jgi:hypothetical protein